MLLKLLKPQSTTSEKSEKLWSFFLSHLVCMKPHLAAANSVTEGRKSCVCCWQAPSSWQDSHTGLLQGPAPPQTPGATDVLLLEHLHSHCPSCLQWSYPVSSHVFLFSNSS